MTWVRVPCCTWCGEQFTPIFDGQTRHPGCHTCQTPTSTCPDCTAERRAHRRTVAKQRAHQFTRRQEGRA